MYLHFSNAVIEIGVVVVEPIETVKLVTCQSMLNTSEDSYIHCDLGPLIQAFFRYIFGALKLGYGGEGKTQFVCSAVITVFLANNVRLGCSSAPRFTHVLCVYVSAVIIV